MTENVDLMKAGKESLPIKISGFENKTMVELACDVGILFRDGYNAEGSNFEHEDPPSLPIYEKTMSVAAGVQRRRKCAQQTVNKKQKTEERSRINGGKKRTKWRRFDAGWTRAEGRKRAEGRRIWRIGYLLSFYWRTKGMELEDLLPPFILQEEDQRMELEDLVSPFILLED